MPSQSSWQRLIGGHIDAAEFDKKVGGYFQTLRSAERQLYNLDGKVVRGTVEKDTSEQLYLLALQEQKTNLVVEQTEVKRGENEISAGKRLLDTANLEDKIISGDAIFAQQELSRKVVLGGREYLWKLRANQGKIYELAKQHFEKLSDRYLERASSLEKGHGRSG